ncbi:MAG: response regulator [Opitutae bacterium]|nr:response regulator [Opitutae bacterium]
MSPAASTTPPARILVVDDDEGLLILMAEALRAEGHAVNTAASCREAFDRLKSEPHDLLLLDLKLRDAAGIELLEKYRASDARVPFVVVTGQGDEKAAVEVMKHGALDYVMKDTALLDLLPSVAKRALESIARDQALAAARAEHARLEGEVRATSERERHAIGADLHDGLGQLLTAVEFMCTALKADTLQTQPDVAARLEQMSALLREAVAQTRFLARGLVPLGSGPDALYHGLAALAERTNALGHVHCALTTERVVEVPDAAVASHLYRIAQEAVNNAVKHARAGNIRVSLMQRAGRLTLEIADDGVGIRDEAEKRGTGLGLMRHRAGLIGADFNLKRPRAGGTVIACTWPGKK